MVPIETAGEFEKHLREISEVVYRNGGRRNRYKKIHHYSVELCIVLTKEKLRKLPTTSIICNNTEELVTASSNKSSHGRLSSVTLSIAGEQEADKQSSGGYKAEKK